MSDTSPPISFITVEDVISPNMPWEFMQQPENVGTVVRSIKNKMISCKK